jgi:hypothetical protein
LDVLALDSDWAKAYSELEKAGYTIYGANEQKADGRTMYWIDISNPTSKQWTANSPWLRITAGESNDAIVTLEIALHGRGQMARGIAISEWNAVNPNFLLSKYGSPEKVSFKIVATEGGLIATIALSWESQRFAAIYTLPVDDARLVSDHLQVCIRADQTSYVALWLSSARYNVATFFAEQWINQTAIAFTPDMFVGLPSVEALAAALAEGKCVETPLALWR